jgi:hypothetical protein
MVEKWFDTWDFHIEHILHTLYSHNLSISSLVSLSFVNKYWGNWVSYQYFSLGNFFRTSLNSFLHIITTHLGLL